METLLTSNTVFCWCVCLRLLYSRVVWLLFNPKRRLSKSRNTGIGLNFIESINCSPKCLQPFALMTLSSLIFRENSPNLMCRWSTFELLLLKMFIHCLFSIQLGSVLWNVIVLLLLSRALENCCYIHNYIYLLDREMRGIKHELSG